MRPPYLMWVNGLRLDSSYTSYVGLVYRGILIVLVNKGYAKYSN
jgi:hypothetical protein